MGSHNVSKVDSRGVFWHPRHLEKSMDIRLIMSIDFQRSAEKAMKVPQLVASTVHIKPVGCLKEGRKEVN